MRLLEAARAVLWKLERNESKTSPESGREFTAPAKIDRNDIVIRRLREAVDDLEAYIAERHELQEDIETLRKEAEAAEQQRQWASMSDAERDAAIRAAMS